MNGIAGASWCAGAGLASAAEATAAGGAAAFYATTALGPVAPAGGTRLAVTDVCADSGLGELAALGPFFAVGSHSPGAPPPASWRPGSELAGPSDSVAARVAAVRAALAARGGRDTGDVEPRVAGSAVHLGLVARLISPALGAAVLRCPVDLGLSGLWWQDELGGAMPLSVPAPADHASEAAPSEAAPSEAPAPEAEPAWERRLLDETIAPVTAAVAGLVPVSGRVLWGNVASAINTAAAQVARQRPDLAADAWQVAGRLLADSRLRDEPCPPGPAFRRASCCLYYRLAPGDPSAICGDCVLSASRAP
ncbi:MAG TPA: IucA/IucC family C-terminal-domain containing protein [Trebonia sp.]|nr:IucA/IucC family C-terminal-domain containing protein [Trebonia sp.]